jgi:hypothetical protein
MLSTFCTGDQPCMAEKVETDDAVRVDVWMHGYWAVGAQEEGYFWGLWVGMLASWRGGGVWRDRER